uniref:Myb/SANT-like DNA-binding domain-containing protein n=1 Tax=Gopherus agassizii TaxID=38772 RepID=A0A452IZC7_9SAUR
LHHTNGSAATEVNNVETLDLLSVWGEETVQSQLCSSRRNYDTFGQISRDMMERRHDRDALQCRVKMKELQHAYRKAREANCCSSAAPATCHFYNELDAILEGDPTSTPSTTMDTSELSSTRQEEEQSRSEGAEVEEDTLEFLDACSQELFSSQEEGSQLWQLVLGEGQTPEEVPGKQLLFWEEKLFGACSWGKKGYGSVERSAGTCLTWLHPCKPSCGQGSSGEEEGCSLDAGFSTGSRGTGGPPELHGTSPCALWGQGSVCPREEPAERKEKSCAAPGSRLQPPFLILLSPQPAPYLLLELPAFQN